MELKRAAELTICALLRETLSGFSFYPSRGGGDDITPNWQSGHAYKIGDVLRPTNHALLHAIVVTSPANSGSTEPAFDDTVGATYGGMTQPVYQTIVDLAVDKAVDAGQPLPPFGVVSIDDAEKTMGQEETDLLLGTVVWVTRADATNIVDHSKTVKRIYDALTQIGSGYDIMRRLMVHGIDVGKTDEFVDEAKQAHGDTISFTMAVTERLAQG